jgi:hypothetical protein
LTPLGFSYGRGTAVGIARLGNIFRRGCGHGSFSSASLHAIAIPS